MLIDTCVFAEQGQEWQDGEAVTGVLYKTSDDTEHTAMANLTIVCDGMHSTLRKKLGTPDLKTPSHFVGLKLKGCKLPYPNFGHVVLANPSPLLFYPISSTEVSTQHCQNHTQGLHTFRFAALQAYITKAMLPQQSAKQKFMSILPA